MRFTSLTTSYSFTVGTPRRPCDCNPQLTGTEAGPTEVVLSGGTRDFISRNIKRPRSPRVPEWIHSEEINRDDS